ncbi:hypothetical protein FRC10_005410 [Ceratobasidium sp. 414]|nr:hypothetical protein FRC10_005410 [Ceratobasidium sp. 414]
MSEFPDTYRLRNAQSGTFMTLDVIQGRPIVGQSTANDEKSIWKIVPVSTGGYKLKNEASGLEAHMDGASGGKLFGAASGTVWSIQKTANNELAIQAYARNTYVVELDQIRLVPNKSAKNQLWIIDIAKPQERYPFPPGIYVIKNVKTGTVIDLQRGAPGEGISILGFQFNDGANQKWDIQGSGNGSNMTIRSVATGAYAAYPSFEQGALLKSSAQPHEYIVTAADKGYYFAPVQKPDHVVDLTKGFEADETEICLWIKHTQDHQKWYVERA